MCQESRRPHFHAESAPALPQLAERNWSGNQIAGTISADGNRIDWDNGTFWTR